MWSDRSVDLAVVVVVPLLAGVDFREAGFRNGGGRSLDTFPRDLVVEFSRNAVFSRKVEVAGLVGPVLCVVSWLQVQTGCELNFVWIQSQ